jgi:hypothetical protein
VAESNVADWVLRVLGKTQSWVRVHGTR